MNLFNKLGISSAPTFLHFPGKGKRKQGDTYDIQSRGPNAEQMAKWVLDRTGIPVSASFFDGSIFNLK